MTPKQNFFLNPTRRQYTILLVLYAVAILLLTAGMTNIFEGAFIDCDFEIHLNLLSMMMILSCLTGVLSVSRNYRSTHNLAPKKLPGSWIKNPTTLQWLIYTVTWFITCILYMLSMTNLVEENFSFKNFHVENNLIMWFIWLAATFAVIQVNINYFRNRRRIS